MAGCKLFKHVRKTMVCMRRYNSFNAAGILLIAELYAENKLHNYAIGTTEFFLNIYTSKLNVPNSTTIYVFRQAPLLLD